MSNFVKRVGKELHDINNRPFTFKGVGIGGWLLIEGYMIKSFGKIDRPRRMYDHIEKLTNEKTADWFFSEWVTNFFNSEDIKLIKNDGFNSVRIAIDYAFLFEPSDLIQELEVVEHNFEILDRIIEVCAKHQLYVIVDLHAAPGGQTGTNIDNSKNDHPDLFVSELYQLQTIYVWKTIASRYKKEQYIGAYDLLNEPLPDWQAKYNDLLVPLYKRIIEAIREVDKNHLITLEGLHWSTDLSCFTELLDDNLLLQFHKYWSSPDKESIQQYLDLREKLDVPLYMGEGGENNLLWYSTVFKLYEQLDISYAFWTYKKMDNTNSIVSFEMPSNWERFLNGELNDTETLVVLVELLDNVRFNKTTHNKSVSNHILLQNDYSQYSFGYDFVSNGISFHRFNHHDSSMRINDGIKILTSNKEVVVPNFKQFGGEDTPDKDVLYTFLDKDEWIGFTYKNCGEPFSVTLDSVVQEDITIKANGIVVVPKNGSYFIQSNLDETKINIKAVNNVKLGIVSFKQQ